MEFNATSQGERCLSDGSDDAQQRERKRLRQIKLQQRQQSCRNGSFLKPKVFVVKAVLVSRGKYRCLEHIGALEEESCC